MADQEFTAEDFLDQLDKLNPKADRDETKKLLAVADKLFEENTELQTLIKSGDFVSRISGNSYIDEVYDRKTFKRPVIDLVQQGGIMLGIGLVGYTYTMEKAGVRFRSMAGTSAGAINTLLVAAVPERIYEEKSPFDKTKQATKSEFLAHLVANKDFIVFLDREGPLGNLQRWLVKRITKLYKIRLLFKILTPLIFIYSSYWLYHKISGYLFTPERGLTIREIKIYEFITGTGSVAAVLLLLLMIVFSLFKKTMGFNPGTNIYAWMNDILKTPYANVRTTRDLENSRASALQLKYRVVKGNKEDGPGPAPGFEEAYNNQNRLVFIAANLTDGRIAKFPDNAKDYWNKEYAPLVIPVAYVRASMSLPFIYDAFLPGDDHVYSDGKPFSKTVDMHARFVDGGMLSNFPIREFHVPPPAIPKYPTFGVLLSAISKPATGESRDTSFKKLTVFKFILSFISTFRRFYDDEFLRTNSEVKQLVQNIDTTNFNAMDFGMSDQTKRELFGEGAKAAIVQLTKFNWWEYLPTRLKDQNTVAQLMQNAETSDPNNQ